MEYKFREIERFWQEFWAKNQTFKVEENSTKPKYYVLDMFPYPSGAGLHVGHPLGYIASDIYARYKRLQGFNVLHPMGYDSFGLPAEQYAIQTGQHPEKTTKANIQRYREQLDKIGLSFDWSKEVSTSRPEYYRWTQWIFSELFDCYYDKTTQKAERISKLIHQFENAGSNSVNAETDCEECFSAGEWKNFDAQKKEDILQQYRLTYLADSWVNWCPNLGTVLANDEVINGVSERGGHPVIRKRMRQWSMRITAYAERLLQGLTKVDWTDALKEQQSNWIGKSQGASVHFIAENGTDIEVFTTRPDTIFGVSFLVLAPENPLVKQIIGESQKAEVEAYVNAAALKSERDRQSETKKISGVFLGTYATHPFTGEKIQLWIGDYVLATYGTGAVMAVPCGDQRDYDFAKHFQLPIKNIFADVDISEKSYEEKQGKLANSGFLSGLTIKEATPLIINKIEEKKIGKGKTNFRLRDAIFSRQRYWGEPFPVYYKKGIPQIIPSEYLPIALPEVKDYLPTSDGQPPLGNATHWAWDEQCHRIVSNDLINNETIFPMELNTMPGWAGSSWYFLRYMDVDNDTELVATEKVNYWKNVDLYVGGSEHATGHLLYARFWTKFLNDLGYIPFDEPFQKLLNQGMILGRSSFVYRDNASGKFVSFHKKSAFETTPLHVNINFVENDLLDIEAFRDWRPEYNDAEFILEDNGTYVCGHEVEKMSKSKYNVQTPDELVEKFGADTLRLYEMFLGPVEQSKPWDTSGINGVHNFLKKFHRLFLDKDGNFIVTDGEPSKISLKTLHKTIQKIQDDLKRFSFNTAVSNFMICVNELTEQKCNNRKILSELTILLSPYAPHIAEEMWKLLGNEAGTVGYANFPIFNPNFLVEENIEYPVSFNGKVRFKLTLSAKASREEIQEAVMAYGKTQHQLEGKEPKKIIVVPGKIINIVC